ncbi:Fe-S-containing protein [Ruminococcus sp.]|uniref:Fe-S-containing protein n=1 Tax=Ruminococcus sp. TaxID=41978 RepID=UPI0038637D6C
MLKYLVQLTSDLLAQALIIGMLWAYITSVIGKRGHNVLIVGGVLTFIASAAMAYAKNATKIITSNALDYWNLYTVAVFAGSFLLFLIFSINKLRVKMRAAGDYIVSILAALIIGSTVFYALPIVLAYPFNFDLAGETMVSTNFLYRIIGIILGLLIDIVIGIAVYKLFRDLSVGKIKLFVIPVLLIQLLNYAGLAINILLTVLTKKRILKPTDPIFQTFFNVNKVVINYSSYFIFAILLIALIVAVTRFFGNIKVHEEYRNPAEHRKIRARMRTVRRWAVTLFIFTVIAVINLTVIDAYNNKKPDEVPVEECIVMDDTVVVNLTDVADGNLHRFGYTTDSGIQVRFIVIQKPNSSSYGVGLDACDICGEAGYYQRGDQIVCRRCDVVMNVNTIGFKGGCNPKVIQYEIQNGQVIIPIEELVKHEGDFD